MLAFFISIIFAVIGGYSLYKAQIIKIEKDQKHQEQIKLKEQLEDKIQQLYQNKIKLDKILNDEKQKIDEICEREKNKIFEQLKILQQNADYASTKYFEEIENAYNEEEKRYKDKVIDLKSKEQRVQEDIKDAESRYNALVDQINAATKAQLREREKEEKLDFYKLSISSIDLEDIEKLNSIKLMLHKPVILNKLIWSTYFQKQTTEMCKQHIKCGLGIEASATNKLYNSMQKDGVWNFSFELLEECPREKLDVEEKRWIGIYQSNEIGYNETKGNK